MNLQVEPPEKKKRKRKTKNPSPPSSPPSFSLLPDEITVDCLARISRSYYPAFSTVSKSFRSLLSSTELYAARSHLGNTEKCVYVCLSDRSHQHTLWFRLWTNPNRTQPNSMIKKKKKKTIGRLLVPLPNPNLPSLPSLTTVAVGSEIYAIGGPVDGAPSSAVRVLDCRSHTWRDAPSMSVARSYVLTCVYDGKIYVFGVEEDEPWGEVFDTKTQTWERLPNPGNEVRNFSYDKIKEVEGKIYVGYYGERNAYDTKQGKWEHGKGLILKIPSSKFARAYMLRRNAFLFRIDEGLLYEVDSGAWNKVKGLESLEDMYRRNGGGSSDSIAKVVSCGGELFFVWEGRRRRKPYNRMKIWCARIVLEERDGGEMWGNVDWVDNVHTVPTECRLLHCHAVSI